MKSVVFTFILLCLLSLLSFAQGETNKTEAYKIREIGLERNSEDVKITIWEINEKFKENLNNTAVIINYGKSGAVYKRQAEILQMIKFNWNLNTEKFKFINGGDYPFPLTEFWIVPEGAEMPKPTNVAEKVDEVGKAPDGDIKNRIYYNYDNLPENVNLYIINTGTKNDKKARLRHINKILLLYAEMIDKKRIVIIDGGYSKNLKTEFWILKK